MKLITKLRLIYVLVVMIGTIAPVIALAQDVPLGPGWLINIGITKGHVIDTDCLGNDASTKCGLAQIYQTIVNFTKVLLALTGSAALLMFTYGGVQWILAAGSQEKVQKGRAAMEAAAIGIAIILGAWVMVNFIIWALLGGQDINAVTIFGREWFGQPSADPASGGSTAPDLLPSQLGPGPGAF